MYGARCAQVSTNREITNQKHSQLQNRNICNNKSCKMYQLTVVNTILEEPPDVLRFSLATLQLYRTKMRKENPLKIFTMYTTILALVQFAYLEVRSYHMKSQLNQSIICYQNCFRIIFITMIMKYNIVKFDTEIRTEFLCTFVQTIELFTSTLLLSIRF